MTWKEFIHKCGTEIGKPEIWPQNDSDGAIQAFHLDRAYVALQSVLTFLPLQRLAATYGIGETVVTAQDMPGQYSRIQIPDTILPSRPDFGIDSLTVEDRVFHPDQATDHKSFFATLRNPFQVGNKRFAFSPSGKSIYLAELDIATAPVTLNHFVQPTKATATNANTEAFPLKGIDAEAALQVVSAHAALDGYDAEMFKAHQILSTFYNGQG